MFSLFKKKIGSSDPVPKWASFFDAKEYSLFMNEVDAYFKKKKINYDTHNIGNGVIQVAENEFGFDQLGLVNLAQLCKQQAKADYAKNISSHFDSMARSNEFGKEFNKIVGDFEQIKQYVGVRLYDHHYIANIPEEYVLGKDIAGDIYAMLVFDLPDSVINIKPEQSKKWNKNFDWLFNYAVENIKAQYPVSVTQEKIGDFYIWFVQGDHFFVPNIIFDLDNRKDLVGTYGSLIGVPHRHAAIIYPIENLKVVKVITDIIPVIHGMNEEGPGSLSDNLLWYSNKEFVRLPYKFEENKIQFTPPGGFLDMLNKLE